MGSGSNTVIGESSTPTGTRIVKSVLSKLMKLWSPQTLPAQTSTAVVEKMLPQELKEVLI